MPVTLLSPSMCPSQPQNPESIYCSEFIVITCILFWLYYPSMHPWTVNLLCPFFFLKQCILNTCNFPFFSLCYICWRTQAIWPVEFPRLHFADCILSTVLTYSPVLYISWKLTVDPEAFINLGSFPLARILVICSQHSLSCNDVLFFLY